MVERVTSIAKIDGVGEIAKTIKDAGVWVDTLFIFLTDNGGSAAMHANSAPLRGFKQQDYEGGIRVPFFVFWPKRLKGGTACELFNIAQDIGETSDLAKNHPEKLAELQKLHDAWLDEMAPPVSGSPKKWDPGAPPAPRQEKKRSAAKRL